jgi:spore germination protein
MQKIVIAGRRSGMRRIKCPRIRKLSAERPEASIQQAERQLTKLQQMTSQSSVFGEEIGDLVDQLRQVASPSSEPFIFTSILEENKKLLQSIFKDCGDIEFRNFDAGGKSALLVYLEGMADTSNLERNVIKPLMSQTGPDNPNTGNLSEIFTTMKSISEHILGASSVSVLAKASAAIDAVMMGNALLLIDGLSEGLSISAVKYVKRNIGGANNEHILRGPNEAFNEGLTDNIVLIRRRSRDTNIKVQILKVGERTKNSIALLYVANLVKPGLVEEVERRIKLINTDKVLASAKIEEFIVDHPWSPFPQVQTTERPDKVLAALYEGRVGLILDGTPSTLLVPCTYNVLMQSADDYTIQPVIASLIRLTRNVTAFIAIYLPAIYVSVVSYHPGMLPTTMAISVAELRARTPFPSFLEAIMMEILLEVFQEAIVRLPQRLSGAATMLGAFMVGTTIVQAGLINPLLVVVVAVTAISSYSMPSYPFNLALRWLRIPMLALASILGLYGVIIGILAVTTHACSLRSFGESYIGGLFDINLLSDWKDGVVRLPAKLLRKRPKEFGSKDQTRGGEEDG